MAKPATYDIEINQGSTFVLPVSSTDIDFSSFDSIRMQIRQSPGSAGIWNSESIEDSVAVTVNTLTITIRAEETADFEIKEGGYDIEMVLNGVVQKLFVGSVTITQEYTHDELSV